MTPFPRALGALRRCWTACLRDEQGNEVIEYVLLLGFVVLASIAVMGALGIRVMDKWAQLRDSL